jgi:membrane protein required for colicin V production
MPSYLDIAVIAVIVISALLSMVRGFTREVLAIASWGAAAVAALYLYPHVLPYVYPQYIPKENIAKGVAAAGVFFVTLIVVSIITVKISDSILDSKAGALDRTLGLVFGAARGFLLCVVGFLFFLWLVDKPKQPDWMQTAKTRPFLERSGDWLKSLLPEDPTVLLQRLNKPKGPGEDTPAEPDPGAATPPKAPATTGTATPSAPAQGATPAPAPVPAPPPGTPPAPGQKKG